MQATDTVYICAIVTQNDKDVHACTVLNVFGALTANTDSYLPFVSLNALTRTPHYSLLSFLWSPAVCIENGCQYSRWWMENLVKYQMVLHKCCFFCNSTELEDIFGNSASARTQVLEWCCVSKKTLFVPEIMFNRLYQSYLTIKIRLLIHESIRLFTIFQMRHVRKQSDYWFRS